MVVSENGKFVMTLYSYEITFIKTFAANRLARHLSAGQHVSKLLGASGIT